MHTKFKKGFSLIELSIVIVVIGVLIAGVMTGSNLIQKSKLTTARTLTNSSPVSSIKGLTLWLEATGKNAFKNSTIDDGDSISDWVNINSQTAYPQANDVGQTEASHQPTYSGDGINGLPGLYFDGTDDRIKKWGVKLDSLLSTDQGSIFMVIDDHRDNTSTSQLFEFYSYGQGGMTLMTSTYTTYFPIGTMNASFSNKDMGVDLDASYYQSPQIVHLTHKGNNSKLMINNVTKISESSSINDNSVSANYYINIGRSHSNRYPFKGMIGEIIVFNRGLKAEESSDVNKYLAQKWGISLEG